MKVYGIDIIAGSVRSRTKRPVYALVIIDGGEVTNETEVSHFRLMRMLSRDEPDLLAVDSIQELAVDQHELCTFMQTLPPMTRLVQVTGGEKKETLGKIAARYNISFNRFDPFAEARTIARVAYLGGGAEVVAFENGCDVVVSRHRSLGKGGWSQNRYVRKIHGAVLQRAREIEQALLRGGLRYEKKESRAFGGASRVIFHIQANRGMVPIHAYRGTDVQVRIACRRLDRIRFRQMSERPPYLIVGIDPGTTTAYAALDLDGHLIQAGSSRQMSMADSIEALYRLGKPLVIASDVQQMPYSVEKIRRAFNAVSFTPREDRSVEEKQELTDGYTYANAHERDALAAALDAFRYYRHKLQNVIKRVPPGYDLNEVRAGMIRGLSLEQVLGSKEEIHEKEAAEPASVTTESKRDDKVSLLEGQVKRLREYVEELELHQREHEREILRLQKQLQRERTGREQQFKRETEIAKRDLIIQNLKRLLRGEQRHIRDLKKRLDRLRQHAAIDRTDDAHPAKVLSALTREGIHLLTTEVGVNPGDVLYVAKTDGWGRTSIKELADLGIRALIVGAPSTAQIDTRVRAACAEFHIPLLAGSRVRMMIRGKSGSLDRKQFEDALKEWEKELEQQARQKATEKLESIFREYRWEREKEVHRGG